MKKIIVGFFALAMLMVGNSAFASGWNTYPSDCPLPLTIGNYTTGQGIQNGSNGCWTLTSVSASAGQTINVAVYYDNTNNANANNTVIHLNQSPAGTMTNPSTTFNFSGSLDSSVGSLNLSQVTANLSSSQTLTFSQAKWFKHGTGSGISLPNGQTGFEAFGSGLSLGTINDGDWGDIVFSFSVGSTVQPSNCTISNFTANGSTNTTITSGNSATIAWATNNCTSVNVSGPNMNSTNTSGSQVVYPTSTSTYTITASGQNGGTQTQTVTVNVNTTQNNCYINSFTANGSSTTTVQSGNTVTIAWNTTGCTSVTVSGSGIYSNNFTGNQSIYPTSSNTYTITAYGNGSGSQTQTVYVNVNDTQQNNCYINNFTANGSTTANIQSGDAVNLSWSTSNCNSVTVSGPGIYSNSLSSYQTVYPTSYSTYTITAYSNYGNNQTRTVYVNTNGNGNNNCYISSFNANGSTNTTIQSGNPVTLTWYTYGCTSATISGPGIYSNALTGNQVIYPTNSGTYTINAYGNNSGTQTRTVYVTVNPVVVIPVTNDCAVTTVATNIGQTNATLNGLVTNSSGASYFEYGTTVGLGLRTASRNANGAFSDVVTGLSSNTIYYYRFVSQCQSGLSYGKIEVFQTQGAAVPPRTVIVQGTTVIGTQSPIMLKIEDRYLTIGLGDIVDYTVTYKNIGKSLLTNPVVQVIVPRGITLINSSGGTYSVDTNTLTVPLQNLKPGDEGVIYVQGRVDALSSNTAQIVTTAILVYTSPNGAQENAIAYVLNNPREILNNLGASAFFLGIFPTTLLGWLMLALLILLIVLATRRFSRKTVHMTTPSGSTTTTTHY